VEPDVQMLEGPEANVSKVVTPASDEQLHTMQKWKQGVLDAKIRAEEIAAQHKKRSMPKKKFASNKKCRHF
jgi:hypothetical protein